MGSNLPKDQTTAHLRPSETTAVVDCVEFVGDGEDRPSGVYVTVKVDDSEVRWSAGRVAIRYIK